MKLILTILVIFVFVSTFLNAKHIEDEDYLDLRSFSVVRRKPVGENGKFNILCLVRYSIRILTRFHIGKSFKQRSHFNSKKPTTGIDRNQQRKNQNLIKLFLLGY